MTRISSKQGPTATFDAEVAAKIRQNEVKIQMACGGSLHNIRDWARRRLLPFKHRETVKRVLGLRDDQLPLASPGSSLFTATGQLNKETASTYNLFPLIKILVEAKCEVVTQDDLVALVHATHQLQHPINPVIVMEVIRKRHQSKK